MREREKVVYIFTCIIYIYTERDGERKKERGREIEIRFERDERKLGRKKKEQRIRIFFF